MPAFVENVLRFSLARAISTSEWIARLFVAEAVQGIRYNFCVVQYPFTSIPRNRSSRVLSFPPLSQWKRGVTCAPIIRKIIIVTPENDRPSCQIPMIFLRSSYERGAGSRRGHVFALDSSPLGKHLTILCNLSSPWNRTSRCSVFRKTRMQV